MTARKLIEEAAGLIHAHPAEGETANIQAYWKLNEALSLLPDADESASNWQEFDPKREETWPKEDGFYLVTMPFMDHWQASWRVRTSEWIHQKWIDNNIMAWMPLPPAYIKL